VGDTQGLGERQQRQHLLVAQQDLTTGTAIGATRSYLNNAQRLLIG
jgi:hypothetical protein